MAKRLKTIQYAWPIYNTTVANATLTDIGAITIYIPENSVANPVVFKSVSLEVSYLDMSTATGATVTNYQIDCTLNGSSPSSYISSSAIANTAENMGGVLGPIDFTSYFVSDWGSGITSKACNVGVLFNITTGTTLTTNNITATIYITYEYEDTEPTQIKTVRIPLESRNTSIPTTYTQIGTNQIPALNTFLPESGVQIRDYFFIVEGNQHSASTTDIILRIRIDTTGIGQSTAPMERALTSDLFFRNIFSAYASGIPNINTTHQFFMNANIASCHHCVIDMIVTYEFDAVNTTETINSIMMPWELGSPMGLHITNPSVFNRIFSVQEPEPITLQQSAVRLNWNASAPIAGLNVRCGNQNYIEYTNTATMICGMLSLQQRIDGGSSVGSGIPSFNRGCNDLSLNLYRTDATNDPTNLNGYFTINYKSGVHPSGVGAHSHTIHSLISDWSSVNSDRVSASGSVNMPESSYWIIENGFKLNVWNAVAGNAITLDAKKDPNEIYSGYVDLYSDALQTDPERGTSIIFIRGRYAFQRFPEDIDVDRMDIRVPREYRMFFGAAIPGRSLTSILTYHSIYRTVQVQVLNYPFADEEIVIDLYHAQSHERLERKTVVNSIADFVWYDDTIPLFAIANQGNLYGRSQNSTEDLLIIDLAPGGLNVGGKSIFTPSWIR